MAPSTCIILAGGVGSRLRSAVPDRPKCLAPVGDRIFLEIQLERLASEGISDFVLSLGVQAELVQAAVEMSKLRSSIRTVVEAAPLGTGGAIALAMDVLGLDEAIVMNGDTFLDGSLAAIMTDLETGRGEFARMAVVDVSDRARFGGVEVAGDRVVGFVEKGCRGPGLINAGLYRVRRSVVARIAPGTPCSFETVVLPHLAEQRQIGVARVYGSFADIGVPEDYARFCLNYA